jgi:hypothetical protein
MQYINKIKYFFCPLNKTNEKILNEVLYIKDKILKLQVDIEDINYRITNIEKKKIYDKKEKDLENQWWF